MATQSSDYIKWYWMMTDSVVMMALFHWEFCCSTHLVVRNFKFGKFLLKLNVLCSAPQENNPLYSNPNTRPTADSGRTLVFFFFFTESTKLTRWTTKWYSSSNSECKECATRTEHPLRWNWVTRYNKQNKQHCKLAKGRCVNNQGSYPSHSQPFPPALQLLWCSLEHCYYIGVLIIMQKSTLQAIWKTLHTHLRSVHY